jgi:hypothetical protein
VGTGITVAQVVVVVVVLRVMQVDSRRRVCRSINEEVEIPFTTMGRWEDGRWRWKRGMEMRMRSKSKAIQMKTIYPGKA